MVTATPEALPVSGLSGRCALELVRSGERTVLGHRYAHRPWGTPVATRPGPDGVSEVVLVNPSGGVLGGDDLELSITARAGTRATVTTQGATTVYRGADSVGSVGVDVGPGATLEFLPHHVIPFAGSRWGQRTVVDVASDARLLIWDAVAAGRMARGERFAFGRLWSRTTVRRDGVPLVVDGYALDSGGEPFGGFSYLASAVLVAPFDLAPVADAVAAALSGRDGVLGSASAPARGLVTVRVLARSAAGIVDALRSVRACARAAMGLGPVPREIL